MTIEIAPKPSNAASAKSSEGSSAGQKSSDKLESGRSSTAKDFGAALASAEEDALPVATASATVSMADGLAATSAERSLEKTVDATSGGLPDPALLLGQASVVPVPDAVRSADGVRGKAGTLPLQAALGSARGVPQAPSGQAVLDAVAQAAQSEVNDASVMSASAPAIAFSSKEITPERIHEFVQELTVSLPKVPEASTLALGSNRERPQEFQSNPRGGSAEVSVQNWAAPQGAGGAMGVDGVVAGAATASADGQYAEQVSYWIGPDVQKAEMTLDGLGANPVEVSISMQGKEATVVFRSDEALTRDALSNASAQLQDAMGRQGVVLSGVSVGTSNSGDPQRKGSGGKPHGWKVGTVEASAEPVTSGPRHGSSGRSIDLFV